MNYLTFSQPERQKYPVAILVKYLRKLELKDYVAGMEDEVFAITIPNSKNPKNPEIKTYLEKLLPALCKARVEYVLVTDASYFKYLTKAPRVDRFSGYVLPCKLDGYEFLNVIYVPSPAQLIYDPNQKSKLEQGLRALYAHRTGTYVAPGSTIVQFAEYPHTVPEIAAWLEKLIDVPLAIDIEAYSLKHYDAGIGTICMAWSQHEGIAFSVDKDRDASESRQIRELLRKFFEARTARTLYHRAWYDVYVLIYQLFMRDVLDTEGMLYGMEIMLRNWDDTQLIRYLATNSCAGNKLSLKDVAQEHTGNYAVEVSDISTVPLDRLLEYNLVDGLATWYAYNKHWQTVVDDQQLEIYSLFKEWMWDILQMQLTGLPMDMAEVKRGKAVMEGHRDAAIDKIMASSFVYEVMKWNAQRWADSQNQKLKVKRVTLNDCPEKVYHFNLNSPMQLQYLLHELMKLPVLKETDTGQPKTGMDAVEELIHHCTTPEQKEVLAALIEYKQVEKILTAFIPAFEAAHQAPDGWHYLYGSFNLGGTLSGRLSSSDPNLQNLPASGSKYRKLIKKMFKAPPGKLLVGLDFASLEDRISALTTKDPNKLKVYTDGYDGHCLRAFAYFGDQMPDIVETVESINSIATLYKDLRQNSKTPTFALTYQGTVITLVNQGFPKNIAQQIYDRYHALYVVSDQWVQAKLDEAAKTGYVTLAFGLRLRTPMMQQCVMNVSATPYEAIAEGRSAGNALGQCWCMLNSRAWGAFGKTVRAHPEYRTKIRPCAQIHDAGYAIVDNDADLLAWMNVHLVKEVDWQEAPEIQHPEVGLGGELSVFYPTWADELTIPNGADASQILQLATSHMERLANGK